MFSGFHIEIAEDRTHYCSKKVKRLYISQNEQAIEAIG